MSEKANSTLSQPSLFGWDVVYNAGKNAIVKKADVVVLLIHWKLLQKGFRCIGLGDNKEWKDTDQTYDETLPDHWSNKSLYKMRYLNKNEVYVLCLVQEEDLVIINFVRLSDSATGTLHLDVERTVNSLSGPLEALVPSYNQFLSDIEKAVIEGGQNISSAHANVQTESTCRRTQQTSREPDRDSVSEPDPLRVGPPRRGCMIPSFDESWDPNTDPLAVGRSDLDPFSRGGGMLFNPFGNRGGFVNPGAGIPGGLPRGSIPPGARFDPFGPPGVGPQPSRGPPRRGGFGMPDPDHLPPPGYDDMFM